MRKREMSIYQPCFNSAALRCAKTLLIIAGICFLSSCALWDASNASPNESDDAGDIAPIADILQDTVGTDATDDPIEDALDDISDTSDTPGCQGLGLDQTFAVAPGSSNPQYQVRAAFDGTGIWVVYTEAADEESANDNYAHHIFATRISCSGEQRATPIQLNLAPIYLKNPAPTVEIKDGTVYFAWSTKSSQGGQATDIMMRTYNVDGEAMMLAPQKVVFNIDQRIGEWRDVSIVALSATRAVIAATGGNTSGSQIFMQVITQQGESISPAVLANSALDNLQKLPVAAIAASGDIWVGWQQLVVDGATNNPWFTHYRSFASDTLSPLTDVTRVGKQTTSSPMLARSDFSAQNAASEQTYFVLTSRYETGPVVYLGNATHAIGLSMISAGTGMNESPSVAAAEDGGVVAWHFSTEEGGSFQAEIYTQTFSDNRDMIELNAPRSIATFSSLNRNQRLLGGPSIVHVGGDNYFVVWHENPDSMVSTLRGRFIEF